MKAILALMMCLLTLSVSSQIIITYEKNDSIKVDTIGAFFDLEVLKNIDQQSEDVILGGDFNLMFTSPYGFGEGNYLFLNRPIGAIIGESNALAEEWLVIAMKSDFNPYDYEYKLIAIKK